MKKLVFDIDGTLTIGDNKDYNLVTPNTVVIEKIREYKELGFEIILHTARNMRSHENNIGIINAKTLPILFKWLEKHRVIYDEIHVGKPWCGLDGFYIDDKAIRPSEFEKLSYDEIIDLINKEKK
jgi:capsule biosynthesis phosphatase